MQFTSKSIVKAVLSAVLIFVAAFGWFSIGLSRRQPLTSTQSEEGVTADGTNDSPPEYDRAIRGKNRDPRSDSGSASLSNFNSPQF